MQAAVYRGESRVVVEDIPTPAVGPGELLIRVATCGVCHTDLKKVEYDLLPPPRVYGHETAGTVAAVGEGAAYKPGDRVIVFHHVPCRDCFYCRRKLYAQCPVYKRVGVTAGFEPAGGGFAQYVRAMDWIVRAGVEKIPDGISFEEASFVEPLNTCLKAVDHTHAGPEDVALVMGQGPIGLLFTMLLAARGCHVAVTDTIARRRDLARECGAHESWDPRSTGVPAELKRLTQGRGADLVFVATAVKGLIQQAIDCSRPGASICLFAQTSDKERIELSGASVCVAERTLFGSYSSSIDLQKESARLVFEREAPVAKLISHRFPLARIREAFDLATHPTDESLKIVVECNRE